MQGGGRPRPYGVEDWSGRIDVRCRGGFETRPYDVTVRFFQGCTGCTTRSWRSFNIDGCKGAAGRAPTWLGDLSGRIDVRCRGGFETRPYDVTVRFFQGCTGCTTRSWRSFNIDGCKGAACRAPTWLGDWWFDRLRMSGLFIGVAVGWREAGFPPRADLSAASLSAYGRGHAIIWTVVPWLRRFGYTMYTRARTVPVIQWGTAGEYVGRISANCHLNRLRFLLTGLAVDAGILPL